jgi:signal recognition particle receptor subunit beta
VAIINFARREIEAKIVFYGPALSGKTTNVKAAFGCVPEGQRGQLSTLSTEDERTLFFDYAPITLGKIAGFAAHFKLFSVPGQAFYTETRKAVLQGADAVVFVADSAQDRAEANRASLADLEENLKAHGVKLSEIPFVIQLNKRDEPGARSIKEMGADLNRLGVPMIEAVAITGEGVERTLRTVTQIAADRIRDNLAGHKTAVQLNAVEREDREDDASVILKQLAEISKVRGLEEQRAKDALARGEVAVDDVDAFLFKNVEREPSPSARLSLDEPPPAPAQRTRRPLPPQFLKLPPIAPVELGFLTPYILNWSAVELIDAYVTPEGGVDVVMLIKDKGGPRNGVYTVNLVPKVKETAVTAPMPEPVVRSVTKPSTTTTRTGETPRPGESSRGGESKGSDPKPSDPRARRNNAAAPEPLELSPTAIEPLPAGRNPLVMFAVVMIVGLALGLGMGIVFGG